MLTTAVRAEAVHPVATSALDPVVLYGVFGLLLFGPLAFGAVEPWAIFTVEAGAAVALLLWSIRQAASGELSVIGNAVFMPMLGFALCVVVQLATGHTAYRYATSSLALLYCAYGLLCFLALQALRRTAHIRAVTLMFSIYGFFLAAFALLQGLSETNRLYWLRMPRSGGWIYGPYVNHNHYAGLMEMLVPIPLVFALTRRAKGPRKALAALAATLMASTVFLSGSRGGILALTVEVVFLAAVVIWRPDRRRLGLALATCLLLAMGLLIWLGGGELSRRLESIHTETRTELSGGIRLRIDRDALRMFARKPVLGWGLGVFPEVYPQFRSFPTNFFINEAHNDYLQLLVEMGSLGFLCMIWFLTLVFWKGAKKLGNWNEDVNGAVALAAMAGVVGILVHSFLDFNLQIPANAALFYVLCMIAAMEPRFETARRRKMRRMDFPEEGAA